MSAHIPASWAATGYGVPGVCVAHGQPTGDRLVVRLYSRPPFWIYLLVLLGGAILGVIVWYAIRKTAVAVWPYCPSCRVLRMRNLGLGAMLLVAGGVGVPLGIALHDGSGLVTFIVVASAVCLVVSLPYLLRSTPAAITGAELSGDGYWVTVHRPPPAFAAMVPQWTAGPDPRTTTPAL